MSPEEFKNRIRAEYADKIINFTPAERDWFEMYLLRLAHDEEERKEMEARINRAGMARWGL